MNAEPSEVEVLAAARAEVESLRAERDRLKRGLNVVGGDLERAKKHLAALREREQKLQRRIEVYEAWVRTSPGEREQKLQHELNGFEVAARAHRAEVERLREREQQLQEALGQAEYQCRMHIRAAAFGPEIGVRYTEKIRLEIANQCRKLEDGIAAALAADPPAIPDPDGFRQRPMAADPPPQETP